MAKKKKTCSICQRKDALLSLPNGFICEDCAAQSAEAVLDQWQQLQKQFDVYVSYCSKSKTADEPEPIHQARVNGRKLRSLLEFLNVPKKHPVLKTIKKIHSLLNPIREADVFLNAFSSRKQAVYKEVSDYVEQDRYKQKKKLQKQLPELVEKLKTVQWPSFMQNELPSYALRIRQRARVQSFEQEFHDRVAHYHQTADAYGKQADISIEALHKVRIRSKALRYMYGDLAERTSRDFSEEEAYFKAIQSQFGDINDLQDGLKKLKQYKKKINAPRTETKKAVKKLEKRLAGKVEKVCLESEATKQPNQSA